MKTAIVMVSWGEAKTTERCFLSLSETTNWDETEVFWFRNERGREQAAFDKLEHRLKDAGVPVVMLESDRNIGFPAAVNQAIGAAGGGYDFYCLLNNDTLVPKGWLDRLIAGMPDDCAAIGPVVDKGGFQQYHLMNVVPPLRNEKWDAYDMRLPVSDPGYFVETPELAFFCSVIPSYAWKLVGPLDEGFGMGYGEDVDWCIRARSAGFRVGVNPCVAIHHDVGATSKLQGKARYATTRRALQRIVEKHGL